MTAPALDPLNNAWLLLCSALVFLMHLGFASLESGLCRSKNTVNILFKNVYVVVAGLISYYVIGYCLMYPGAAGNGYFGLSGLVVTEPSAAARVLPGGQTFWAQFLFQAMFAATSATIVSGAVAERIKLRSFLLFTVLFLVFVYPIAGYWGWGGGFLAKAGFHDFAGSTFVHAVGACAALVGAWMLGPRLGKYSKRGPAPIPGGNLPMATLGAMILWFGWFGFNGGSVSGADPWITSRVMVITALGGAAGFLGALVAYSFVSEKPDLSIGLNGILAGLVSITAGADVLRPGYAVLVAFIGGALTVGAVILLERASIDDPVGAVSVHGAGGLWGTIAVGLFSPSHSLSAQLLGLGAVVVFATVVSALIFWCLQMTMGLRASEEAEVEGLDVALHAVHAYDFLPNAHLGGGRPASRTEE